MKFPFRKVSNDRKNSLKPNTRAMTNYVISILHKGETLKDTNVFLHTNDYNTMGCMCEHGRRCKKKCGKILSS